MAVISCGLSVSLFFACPRFSYACLGLESAAARGLMLPIYFCTSMLLDDLGSEQTIMCFLCLPLEWWGVGVAGRGSMCVLFDFFFFI